MRCNRRSYEVSLASLVGLLLAVACSSPPARRDVRPTAQEDAPRERDQRRGRATSALVARQAASDPGELSTACRQRLDTMQTRFRAADWEAGSALPVPRVAGFEPAHVNGGVRPETRALVVIVSPDATTVDTRNLENVTPANRLEKVRAQLESSCSGARALDAAAPCPTKIYVWPDRRLDSNELRRFLIGLGDTYDVHVAALLPASATTEVSFPSNAGPRIVVATPPAAPTDLASVLGEADAASPTERARVLGSALVNAVRPCQPLSRNLQATLVATPRERMQAIHYAVLTGAQECDCERANFDLVEYVVLLADGFIDGRVRIASLGDITRSAPLLRGLPRSATVEDVILALANAGH